MIVIVSDVFLKSPLQPIVCSREPSKYYRGKVLSFHEKSSRKSGDTNANSQAAANGVLYNGLKMEKKLQKFLLKKTS